MVSHSLYGKHWLDAGLQNQEYKRR